MSLKLSDSHILSTLHSQFDAWSFQRHDHQDVGNMQLGNRRQVLTIQLKRPRSGMNKMSIAERFTNFPLFRSNPTANLFFGWIDVHGKMRHFFSFNHDASSMFSKLYTCFWHDWFWQCEQRPTLECWRVKRGLKFQERQHRDSPTWTSCKPVVAMDRKSLRARSHEGKVDRALLGWTRVRSTGKR